MGPGRGSLQRPPAATKGSPHEHASTSAAVTCLTGGGCSGRPPQPGGPCASPPTLRPETPCPGAKLAATGSLTPRTPANAVDQGSLLFREQVVKHLPAHRCVRPSVLPPTEPLPRPTTHLIRPFYGEMESFECGQVDPGRAKAAAMPTTQLCDGSSSPCIYSCLIPACADVNCWGIFSVGSFQSI